MNKIDSTPWASCVRDALPELAKLSPALASNAATATWLLHGSTTRGIDDAVSDLDAWCLPPIDQPPLFVQFELSGKAGHVQVEQRPAFERRLRQCDFPLIYELRHAIILQDPDGWAERLLSIARRPMPADVQAAWFAHHYIEMRSEHRAIDNPIERRDAIAVLQATTSTIAHALRAALVLDGEPHPFSKWLAHAAVQAPTGRQIVPIIEGLIDDLGAGVLRVGGPERDHPINRRLKQIRTILIDTARARGIDAPWLDWWYLHLDQRGAIHRVEWNPQ